MLYIYIDVSEKFQQRHVATSYLYVCHNLCLVFQVPRDVVLFCLP